MDKHEMDTTVPYVVVLGIAQDGGYPHAGMAPGGAWDTTILRRHAACLGVVDPTTGERWMIEATPDFREQLHMMDVVAPVERRPGLAGIALTHAHIGHYTGLIHLGREVMGTREVPLYIMPRMKRFLESNAPWQGLVHEGNVKLHELEANTPVQLNNRITITPIPVPHRDEYTETVGFRIEGPEHSVLFIPDIDRWELLDSWGGRIEDLIAGVDVAFLDGTFYADGELPGRDMTTIPHPTLQSSMLRFSTLHESERRKIHFIHLNHTNPVLEVTDVAYAEVVENGFAIATELQRVVL